MERNCLYIDKAAYVIVPVDGAKLLVMINCLNGEQKIKPAARRPAAPATLSQLQDLSRCHKFNRRGKIKSIDFGVDCQAVRADEGH